MISRALAVGAFLALSAGLANPVLGQKPKLGVLDQLQPGRWELRLRQPDDGVERICLRDGRRLIQLRHPMANCSQMMVQDEANEVTIQYTCRGHGYGRTQVRKESGRLIQIDSQGVVDGLPFSFTAEGRYIGECPA